MLNTKWALLDFSMSSRVNVLAFYVKKLYVFLFWAILGFKSKVVKNDNFLTTC